MIPDDVPGVVPAPIYTAVPCEDSTCPLADELASKYPQLDAIGVELNILRWLVDNGMVIVKRN